MVDTKKVIKSLKRELSRMTPEKREAYLRQMGLSFDEKTVSKKKDAIVITSNRAQLVIPANSTTSAYRISLPKKTNPVYVSIKGDAHVGDIHYGRKKKKVYE